MKLIHLSDLHLGKRVNDFSMLCDQRYILEQILGIIDAEQPQAVLIAGDVYDKSVPSAEAVELLDDFLCSLAARHVQVFLISGNHDSPERLAFGGRLLTATGIHLSPVYDGKVCPVVLEDEIGPVNFYMLPFIKPAHVRRFFPEACVESYTDAVHVAVEQMGVDPNGRNVLITHQFVTGAERCESEELSVGGSDNVDASVFEAFSYVALGHIHGPQNITPRIRYCGTPLKYSFSEAEHHKSVTVVELEKDLNIRTIPLTPQHNMRQLRGSFSQISHREFYDGTVTNDYLHIILTDEEDVPEALGRLRLIYPNIMKLSYDNTRTRADRLIGGAQEVGLKSPLTLFQELYELQNNQPMTLQQTAFVQALMESIWEDML